MKYTLFLILLLSILVRVHAQEDYHEDYTSNLKNHRYLKAVVVTLEGDSIPALMENYRETYRRYGNKAGKIKAILSTEGKKMIKADDIKGFELTLRNRSTQRYLAVDGIIVRVRYSGERIYLFEREELVLNKLSLPTSAILVAPNIRKKFYVRKKYEAYLLDVDLLEDQVALEEYFAACPGIAKQISINRMKARHIITIVERYDNCDDFTGVE